jgi:hypothetical protein
MLVGHFAVALVGKRIEPRISLGTLMLAVLLPDLLWPIFSVARVEYVIGRPKEMYTPLDMTISHSLLMVILWAALFAGIYFLRRHYQRGARVLFIAVLSHWLLDSISHGHALAPGTQRVWGFGLWHSFSTTIIIEGGFWLIAIILYVRTTYSKKWAGIYAFWPVVLLLTYIWITNVRTGAPPPEAVLGSLIFFLLIVGWSYLMNKARPIQPDPVNSGFDGTHVVKSRA